MRNFFSAKKRFGQHFLRDETVIREMLEHIAPQKAAKFLEIGPGQGQLTRALLPLVSHLEVVEIDRDLIPFLEKLRQQYPQLVIHSADVLTFNITTLKIEKGALRIVGNLPYNISTPLLFHLLDRAEWIQDIHVMLQKEVVDRIVAAPGGADYGRLSVMMQYRCQVEKLFEVPPECFQPPPKVDSAVVRLTPYQDFPVVAEDESLFSTMVTQAFSQRRKMLRNTLKTFLSEKEFIQMGLSPESRPETLSVKDYVNLANYLHQNGKTDHVL